MKLLVDQSESHKEGLIFNGDEITYAFKGDPQPTLDQNARIRNGFDHRKSRQKGWELVASIDNTIALLWRVQYGIDVFNKEHFPRILKLLNSRDWQLCKTTDDNI